MKLSDLFGINPPRAKELKQGERFRMLVGTDPVQWGGWHRWSHWYKGEVGGVVVSQNEATGADNFCIPDAPVLTAEFLADLKAIHGCTDQPCAVCGDHPVYEAEAAARAR